MVLHDLLTPSPSGAAGALYKFLRVLGALRHFLQGATHMVSITVPLPPSLGPLFFQLPVLISIPLCPNCFFPDLFSFAMLGCELLKGGDGVCVCLPVFGT